jgi:hypothetical protein
VLGARCWGLQHQGTGNRKAGARCQGLGAGEHDRAIDLSAHRAIESSGDRVIERIQKTEGAMAAFDSFVDVLHQFLERVALGGTARNGVDLCRRVRGPALRRTGDLDNAGPRYQLGLMHNSARSYLNVMPMRKATKWVNEL